MVVAAGGEDRHLDARSEGGEAGHDEVMDVGVREPAEDPARAHGFLVEEIEVDPPERSGDEKARDRRSRRAGVPAHLRHGEHHRQD